MGLRGPGARGLNGRSKAGRPRNWQNRKLSAAEAIIAFIQSLKLTAGRFAGQPFVLRDWQKDDVRKIYQERNGKRIVRTAVQSLGRKNGKTQLAAALAAAHLYGPAAEPRGEVYSAASDRDQAGRVFRELVAFIEADPVTARRCNIQRFAKKIEVLSGPGEGSIYMALSSDARKAHSLSPSFVVCDELAQWPSRELYDNLSTGTGTRENPLIVIISTMSSNPDHIMSELVHEGEQINAGLIEDESFFASIRSLPMDADIWDEKGWTIPNPALGDFRSLDEMRLFARQAKRSESKEAVFRNLYLNQPVAPHVKRFLPLADWQACERAIDLKALAGKPCIVAIDLSSTGKNDLTAMVQLFDHDDHWIVLPHFWASESGLEAAEKRDHAPYREWVRQGFLQAVPGRVMHYGVLARKLGEIQRDYRLGTVVVDPYKLEFLLEACEDEGLDLTIQPHGQKFTDMDASITALEDAILSWKLIHPNNPPLNWNNDNVLIEIDSSGNRKFSKRRSRGRIDGMQALAMVAGLAKKSAQTGVAYTGLKVV